MLTTKSPSQAKFSALRAGLAGLVLFLASYASAQPVIVQVRHPENSYLSKLINHSEYYAVCEIQLVNGRMMFWELYPGMSTPWYYISYYNCIF